MYKIGKKNLQIIKFVWNWKWDLNYNSLHYIITIHLWLKIYTINNVDISGMADETAFVGEVKASLRECLLQLHDSFCQDQLICFGLTLEQQTISEHRQARRGIIYGSTWPACAVHWNFPCRIANSSWKIRAAKNGHGTRMKPIKGRDSRLSFTEPASLAAMRSAWSYWIQHWWLTGRWLHETRRRNKMTVLVYVQVLLQPEMTNLFLARVSGCDATWGARHHIKAQALLFVRK